MRCIAFGFLVVVAACANQGSPLLGEGQPGINVADAALRGGSPQIALQVTSNILAKDPGNSAALVTQGEALTALGQLNEAGASFSAALQRDPRSVAARVGLGRVRLASDPAAAEALFLEALQREPSNAIALNDLGIARDLQGRHADAQEAYRQALGANPDMQAAQVNLALSLAMSGRAQEGVQLLRPLASGQGASSQMRHDLAAALVMAGNRAEAEQILSADLSPSEVQQALSAYAAARSGAGASTLLAPNDVARAPAEPVTPVLPPTPAPAPMPSAPSPTSSLGGVQVQLAAAVSQDAAQAEWQRLQTRLPDVFAGHQPTVIKVERDGHTFWRLRTAGFSDSGQAATFCDHIRTAGSGCILIQ